MPGKKILIVDDDREAVDFLQKGLLRQGFEVVTAYDGLQAKEKIQEDNPEVIIVDLIMPHLDGWGLLNWLRREQKVTTPTIIISAKDEIDDLKRGSLEADTYLIKPVTLEDVVRGIRLVSALQKDQEHS
jgi:DNA-binding response OmpR family regulator